MIHLGDITRIHGAGAPIVEVIIGGSPCQDLSVAGKRAGLAGERSGLFMDQVRIVKEMRDYDARVNARTGNDVRPRYMVWENVPGAFSSNGGEDFRAVLEEIARVIEKDAVIPEPPNGKWQTAGCIMGDGWSIAWRVLDAQFWGVPQRRRRIALVADFGGDTAPEILFERESVSGDSQEGGEARKGTAGDATGGVGTAVDGKRVISFQGKAGAEASLCIGVDVGASLCASKELMICLNDQGGSVMGVSKNVAGTLRAQGEGTTGDAERSFRKAICYSFDSLASNSMKSSNPHSGCREVECSKTIDCFDPNPSKNQGGIAVVQPVVCMATQQGGAEIAVDLCPTITASAGMSGNNQPCVVYNEETITSKTNASNPSVGDPCHTLGATGAGRTICIQGNCIDRADTAGCNGKGWRDDDVSFTLNTIDRPAVYALDQQGGKGGANYAENVCPSILSDSHGTPHAVYDARENGDGNTAPTLTGDHQNRVTDYTAVCMPMQAIGEYRVHNLVRRLTPLECERLQGYPDGWTDIGEWIDSKGKKHESSDSARYKALGNSIALPPWRFVLSRVNAYLKEHTMASLFDGIGGFPLIWQDLNGPGKCLWASEIEEFPIAVTKRRLK